MTAGQEPVDLQSVPACCYGNLPLPLIWARLTSRVFTVKPSLFLSCVCTRPFASGENLCLKCSVLGVSDAVPGLDRHSANRVELDRNTGSSGDIRKDGMQ